MPDLPKDNTTMASTLPGTLLAAPIPPQLEAAVEYYGDARYFALFWTPAGDEAMVTDGCTTHDGCWWGYQAFVDHPLIALALAGQRYNLGSSEFDATHWLIIDRIARAASIAPREVAEQLLEAQHPPLSLIEMTLDQWNQVVDQLNQAMREQMKGLMAQAELADLREQIARQDAIVSDMKKWLDERLPTDWQARLLQSWGEVSE